MNLNVKSKYRKGKRRKTVNKKDYALGRILTFFFILLFFFFGTGYSQLEELEELGKEEVKCKPDSFTTIYDKYADENVSSQQLGIWYSLAREEYKYKNYKRAVPYYWKVVVNDKSGKFFVAYSRLADCYYNLNFPDSVFIVVYRGLELRPNSQTLHYWGALVHERLGHIECAIPHYEAMVKAQPKNKVYWEKLARFYFQKEDPKAIEAQRKVVELDPQNVEASRLLAQIMEYFGEDPIEAQKETYLKDTTNVDNAMSYGKTLFERGEYEKAIKPFKSVLNQDSKNTAALEYLGRSYEGLNQLTKALQSYRKILEIDPKNVNVLCLTASVYGRLNNFTTARSFVNKAKRIDPDNGLPYMIMAEIYENAVQYCSDQRRENKLTYDDKLVYRLAQEELKKATKDPTYAQTARRRINQLSTLVPTKEDLFMHKNRLQPREKCYSWIH